MVSGVVKVSSDVLVVQAVLVVQNELDVMEELLTNSDDAVLRNKLDKKLNLGIQRGLDFFGVFDDGPGLEKEKVADRILKYGKIIEKDDIKEITKGRGQFNRGLKEVIMSCIKDGEGEVIVESKTLNDPPWAFLFIRKGPRLHYKEISPISELGNPSYFFVRIKPKQKFPSVSSDNTFKDNLESGIKFLPILERHDVYLIDKRGFKQVLKSRKNLVKYPPDGYKKQYEEFLNLKKYNLELPSEYKELEKIGIKLSIREAYQFSYEPLRRLTPSARKNPRIDSTGIIIRDDTHIYGKTLLDFGYREELGYLEITLTIPMLRALAIIGQKGISVPLILPDRSGFRENHPLFLALYDSNTMNEIFEAINYINEKIQAKRRKSSSKSLTRREALTREVINQYLDSLLGSPELQEEKGFLYEGGDLTEKAEFNSDSEIKEKKTEETRKQIVKPVLGVAWRRVKKQMGVFRGDIVSINATVLSSLVHDQGAVRASAEGVGYLIPTSERDLTIDYRPIKHSQTYSNAKFKLRINEEALAGDNVNVKIFINSGEISKLGREVSKICETNEGSDRQKRISSLLTEIHGFEPETTYDYIEANSSPSFYKPMEPVLWVTLPFLVLDPKDEEPEAEKKGYLREIQYHLEDVIEDPVTHAKRPVKELHRAWQPSVLGANITTQNQWDLLLFLKSRFFEPFFDPQIPIDKQKLETRILIANAISMGIAEIIANVKKSEEQSETEVIAKITDELAPILVEIFITDSKSFLKV